MKVGDAKMCTNCEEILGNDCLKCPICGSTNLIFLNEWVQSRPSCMLAIFAKKENEPFEIKLVGISEGVLSAWHLIWDFLEGVRRKSGYVCKRVEYSDDGVRVWLGELYRDDIMIYTFIIEPTMLLFESEIRKGGGL